MRQPTATASFPAASLMRDTSLSAIQVLISFSRRPISAKASRIARFTASSSWVGSVYAVRITRVPIAPCSYVTRFGTKYSSTGVAADAALEGRALELVTGAVSTNGSASGATGAGGGGSEHAPSATRVSGNIRRRGAIARRDSAMRSALPRSTRLH